MLAGCPDRFSDVVTTRYCPGSLFHSPWGHTAGQSMRSCQFCSYDSLFLSSKIGLRLSFAVYLFSFIGFLFEGTKLNFDVVSVVLINIFGVEDFVRLGSISFEKAVGKDVHKEALWQGFA